MAKKLVNTIPPQPVKASVAGAQTGGRALKLLKILAEHKEPISLTEMAEKAQLDISATHRMMRELEANAFAEREPDGKRYVVGGELISLASTVLSKIDMRGSARPILEKLVSSTGETVTLKLRDGLRRITIDGVESKHAVRRVVSFGDGLPLYSTPSGWAILAFLTETEIQTSFKAAEEQGVSIAKARKALSGIRKDGYLISTTKDRGQGHCVLTAPIFSTRGVVGAIAISGPPERWNAEAAAKHVTELLQACKYLSASLGHR